VEKGTLYWEHDRVFGKKKTPGRGIWRSSGGKGYLLSEGTQLRGTLTITGGETLGAAIDVFDEDMRGRMESPVKGDVRVTMAVCSQQTNLCRRGHIPLTMSMGIRKT